MTFRIIWPEYRTVGPGQIETWFNDALANGELEYEFYGNIPVDKKAMELHRAGLITLGQ